MKIVEFIKNLEGINALSKHERLVIGITDAINGGHLRIGDQLPSINTMVDEIGFARKTIVKAYDALKDKGLIESRKTMGYFVVNENTELYLRIAIILYSFQRFQREFYNTLRSKLEDRVQIDVFFHHNNEEVFETIFTNIQAKYGMYIIAPIQGHTPQPLLKSLSPEKLIIVDRFLNLGPDYTYVVQEFDESTRMLLDNLIEKMSRYKHFVLFYREDQDYPVEILEVFKEFAQQHELPLQMIKEYDSGTLVKDTLYITISDSDLWLLLKDCRDSDFRIGKDVGVLSFNDHIVKEIISGGITTISTDFKQMAIATADNIKQMSFTKRIIPTRLIDRDSV